MSALRLILSLGIVAVSNGATVLQASDDILGNDSDGSGGHLDQLVQQGLQAHTQHMVELGNVNGIESNRVYNFKYPLTYTVKGIFHIPYANIHEPITVYTDDKNKRQAVQYYDGLDAYIYTGIGTNNAMSYELYVAKDKKKCSASKVDAGPKSGDIRKTNPVAFLPALDDFVYHGKVSCSPEGERCHMWTLQKKQFERTSNYVFYAKDDVAHTPFLYSMVGYDLPFQSHYDFYRIQYQNFQTGITEVPFEVPHGCEKPEEDRALHHNNMRVMFESLFNAHDHVAETFSRFVEDHSRDYINNGAEYAARLFNYHKNHHVIMKLNRERNGATFAPNHLMDLHAWEVQGMRGYKKSTVPMPPAANEEDETVYHAMSGQELPSHVDWRLSGAITPVKDQGKCGSCWAFSAAQAVEAHWHLKTGQMVVLSEQQIVDCAWDYGSSGCDGGDETAAMTYVRDFGGLMMESDYPYKMENSYCVYDKGMRQKAGATVRKVVKIRPGNEEEMKDALATMGPVTIAYDASQDSMTFYSSGVYYDHKCSSTNTDHAVVVVGFGVDPDGQEYWLVKNSWSTFWGDMGYFRIARNKGNHCGVASSASYPMV